MKYLVLHIGTNSLSTCGLLTRFLREFKTLIEVAQAKFPSAVIFVSELFVRDAVDMRTYNYKLCELCRMMDVQFIRTSIEE